MTKVTTRIEIDLTVVIGECHLEVELGMSKITDKIMAKITDRITEGNCKIVIERTLGEEIIGRCKIIEVNVETIIETIIEMTIEMMPLTEVEEVGLEKDNTHITLEGITTVVVDPHQIQVQHQDTDLVLEIVQIEIGLDALDVGNMAFCQ